MITLTSTQKALLLNNQYYAEIEVNTVDEDEVTITESDLAQGSFAANRFSVSGNTIEIGSAIAGQVEFTIALTEENENELKDLAYEGSEIIVWLRHETEGTRDLNVRLFTGNVDEVVRQLRSIKLVVLDGMVKFDKSVENISFTSATTPTSLISSICSACGVTYNSTDSSLANGSAIVAAPTAENLTHRQLLMWLGQFTGTCAFMDGSGQLVMNWYHKNGLTVDGGDKLTTSNRFQSTLDENSITITDVQIKVGDTTYPTSGLVEGYVLAVEGNELIDENNVDSVLAGLQARIQGFTYTPFTADTMNLCWLQPLDVTEYVDIESVAHDVIITDWTFGLNSNLKLAGKGESATRKGYASNPPFTAAQTRVIEQMKKAIGDSQDIDDRMQAVLGLNDAINHGMMLHSTTVDGQTYKHNAATLADSTYICTANSNGFAWTNSGWNSGNPVWQYGISSDGNAVLEQLSAYLISADVVSTGILKSSDGSTTLNLNTNEASFFNGALLYDTTNGFRFGQTVTFGRSNLSQDVQNALADKGTYYGTVTNVDETSGIYNSFTTDIVTGVPMSKGQTFIVNCPASIESTTPQTVYEGAVDAGAGNDGVELYFAVLEDNVQEVEVGQVYSIYCPEQWLYFWRTRNGEPVPTDPLWIYVGTPEKNGHSSSTRLAAFKLETYNTETDHYKAPCTLLLRVKENVSGKTWLVEELEASKSVPYFHSFVKATGALSTSATNINVKTEENSWVTLVVQNYDTSKFDYATPTTLQFVATEEIVSGFWKCEITQTTGDLRSATALSTAQSAVSTAQSANSTAQSAAANASEALSEAQAAQQAIEDLDVTAAVNAAIARGDISTLASAFYGTCSTAADTAIKEVVCNDLTGLQAGVVLNVSFTNANTAGSPQIRVRSGSASGTILVTAKDIKVKGSTIASGSPYNWQAGATIQFVYTGTYLAMSETSVLQRVAAWCKENDITHIDGGMIATGTVAADQIAANAITTDKLYASNAMLAKLLAKEAFIDGKLKIANSGKSEAQIGTTTLNAVAQGMFNKNYSQLNVIEKILVKVFATIFSSLVDSRLQTYLGEYNENTSQEEISTYPVNVLTPFGLIADSPELVATGSSLGIHPQDITESGVTFKNVLSRVLDKEIGVYGYSAYTPGEFWYQKVLQPCVVTGYSDVLYSQGYVARGSYNYKTISVNFGKTFSKIDHFSATDKNGNPTFVSYYINNDNSGATLYCYTLESSPGNTGITWAVYGQVDNSQS